MHREQNIIMTVRQDLNKWPHRRRWHAEILGEVWMLSWIRGHDVVHEWTQARLRWLAESRDKALPAWEINAAP